MSEINRQITISLKVIADQKVKTEVEAFKKSVIDSAKSGHNSFADFERKKTAIFEAESKKRIEIYRKEITATSQASQRNAVNAVGSSSSGSSGNPLSGGAGNSASTLRSIEALDRQRERAYQQEALAQQKAIAALDKQREKAYQNEVLDAQKAAEQKIKAEQRAIDSLDRQRSKALEQQFKENERAQDRANQAAETSREKQVAASKQVGAATLNVADNVLVAAKGFAYLGLVGEKNSKELLDGLLMVEGGFNAIRGGVGAFFSLRDAIETVRKSVLATAAANELLTIAQKKAAVSGAASAVGGVGAAGAGAVGAGGGMLARLGGGAGRFANDAGRMAGRAVWNPLTAAIATGVGVGELASGALSSDGRGTIGTGVEAFRIWRGNVATGKKITAAEATRERKLEMVDAANQRASDQGAFNDMRRDQRTENLHRNVTMSVSSRTDLSDEKKQIEINRQMKLAAESELDQARAAYAKAEEDRINRQQNHQAAIIGEQLAAANSLRQAAERKRDLEAETLQLLSAQVQKGKESVANAHQSVQNAQDRYNAERESTEGKLAAFARLSPGEQMQLKKIAEKAQSGKDLSRYETETLESHGLGQSIIRDQWSRKGKTDGGETVLNQLGDREGEEDAFLELQQSNARLTRMQMELENEIQAEMESRKRLRAAQDEASRILEEKNAVDAQNRNLEMQDNSAQGNAGVPDHREVAFDAGNRVEEVGRTMVDALGKVNQQLLQAQERISASQMS